MKIETLKDILHWTREFHQQLGNCLAHSTDSNDGYRERLLLDYLTEHEEKLAHVVETFEHSDNTNALNTWCYEFLNKAPIVQHQHSDAPFAELNTQQIMAVIVDQHQQVIELYRHLCARAEVPSAVELLENLKSLEEHEAMKIVHSANRLEDI